MDVGAIELRALIRQFESVRERWGLTPDEVEMLLDPVMSGNAKLIERRKRLIVDLDCVLCDVIGGDFVANWLRVESSGGLDPLTFLALDDAHLPAMLDVARYLAADRD